MAIMGFTYSVKPKNPNFSQKEFFKIAQMEPDEAHWYIIKEYGRAAVNYYEFFMPEHTLLYRWSDENPWIPEDYR